MQVTGAGSVERARTASPGRRAPEIVGSLPDGTPYFAPPGRLLADGDRVCCHLCGCWFLSVASHIRVHGWTKPAYVAAFGLELGNPLTGEATHKRRSAAFTARLAVEPGLVRAQGRAVARARSGALTAAASAAARGRTHPAERRVKTLATLAGISRAARAEGSRRRACQQMEQMAAAVAARFGFADFTAYLIDRLGREMSMAAVSREAGLHKDWVSRRAATLVPEVSATRRGVRPRPSEVPLREVAQRLGFAEVGEYLRVRHLDLHYSVAALAAESGVSRSAILAALRRHGIEPIPHATKRHQSAQRDRAVARSLGFESLAAYVIDRRARGLTWERIAAESGIAETTLRRHSRR